MSPITDLLFQPQTFLISKRNKKLRYRRRKTFLNNSNFRRFKKKPVMENLCFFEKERIKGINNNLKR